MSTTTRKVTVVYPKGGLPNGNQQRQGHKVRPEDKRMHITIEHRSGAGDFEIVNVAARYMNRVDESEIERQLEMYEERSMVPGDYVIIDDNRIYQADMVGFKKVDEVKPLTADTAEGC